MSYEAVIFDLDGTLLDSIEDLADSMNNVLESQGLPTYDIEKYKYFVGDGMYNLVVRTLPPEKREKSFIDDCLAKMQEEYSNRWSKKTRPYPGVPQLLDKLCSLGFKMAVLSNKPHNFTETIVEKLLEPWSFDRVLGERRGIPKKPDPTGALEIADNFKLPPGKFLYLGDTNTDMKTAKAAGMYAVGVLWGFRDASELLENGADTLIEHPMDLLKIL